MIKSQNRFEICSTIKGYYQDENSRAVLIKIYNGVSFWVPKHFVESTFSKKDKILQEFVIENYILKRIGFNIEKYKTFNSRHCLNPT